MTYPIQSLRPVGADGLRIPVTAPARRTSAAGWSDRERNQSIALALLCILPTCGLLALGQVTHAAHAFFLTFLLVGGVLALRDRGDMLLGLLIGLAPFISLLRGRGHVFYNIVVILFALCLVYYWSRSPAVTERRLRGCPILVGLFVFSALYYALSLGFTQDYSRNLRLFELCFTVLAVILVGRNSRMLGMALLVMALSACAIGLAMLPHHHAAGRLGMIVIGGAVLGNPVQLGVALALAFLALTIDQGRWVNLPKSGFVKWLLWIPTTALLALTTSRVAWLIAVGGLCFAVVLGSRQRMRVLLAVAVAALVLHMALMSPYGEGFRRGLERTFNEEKSMGSRTSGRSDQWLVAWHAATAAWERFLCGYGPGRGPSVYAAVSEQVEGIHYAVGREAALHSLLMQVLVEAGMVGALTVVAGLGVALWQGIGWFRRHRLLFPLVCLLSYGFIILTVSGNDTNSGTALGVALLATVKSRRPSSSLPRVRMERRLSMRHPDAKRPLVNASCP